MKKLTLWFLFLSLIALNWCWQEEETQTEEKRAFNIQTKNFEEFDSVTYFRKNWRVMSSEQVEVTAQASGRVGFLPVKEWQSVSQWQTLLTIQDDIVNYNLQLQSWQINLEQAQIDYEQTKSDLQKQIRDLERAKRQAEIDYETAKDDFQKQIEQQEREILLSDLEDEQSRARQELQNIENNLETARLELENLQRRNKQQIRSFNSNLENLYDDYFDLIWDVNHEADKLLWVTSANRNYNNRFDTYLWARSRSTRIQAENLLKDNINKYENLQKVDYEEFDKNNLQDHTNKLVEWFRNTTKLLRKIDKTLKDSVSATTFPQSQIDWYKEKFWAFRSSANNILSQAVSFRDDLDSFIENYEKEEEVVKKEIRNLEGEKDLLQTQLEQWYLDLQVGYDRTLIQKQETLEKANMALQKSEDDLQKAKNDKESTLKSLENNIESARVQYQEAADQVWKLNVTAPISGTISSININRWQEVSQWTPLFEISGDAEKEVRISFRQKELDRVREGMQVEMIHRWNSYIWTIYSISDVADQNLNYTARVRIDEQIPGLGDFVQVLVFVDKWSPILPVNVLRNIQDNVANINIYQDWKIAQKEVEIDEIVADWVLLKNELDDDTTIITNDIRWFNDEEYYLEKM